MKVYQIKELKQKINYKICITCSLFKMNDPYRDFGNYVNKFLGWMFKIPKDSFIRLYTDEITYKSEEFEKLLKLNYNKLEIFIYDYPEFKDSDGYHDGTFGTLMRYLPLWDKKIWDTYKIDYIWITDVDIYINFLNFEILKKMEKEHASICYYAKSGYNVPWIEDEVKYPIGAGKFIVKKNVRFSESSLKNFLKEVLDGKYNKLRKRILNHYILREDESKIKSITKTNYFPYGYDEYYVNSILYEEIKSYKQIVQLNISLSSFKFFLPNIPDIENIREYEYQLWKGKINVDFFKNYCDKIFEEIQKLDFTVTVNFPRRLNICLKDYELYKDKVIKNSNIYGPYVLVNPQK